jgi:hypothetical protein
MPANKTRKVDVLLYMQSSFSTVSDRTTFMRIVAVVAVGVLTALPAWAIRVCSRCSYEVPDSSTNCTHCGASAPAAAPPVQRQAGGEPAVASVVTADLVEREIEAGSRQLRDGDPDVAASFLRNALALDLLTARDPASDRGERVRQLLERCVGKGATVKISCRECGGSGKMVLTMTGVDGKTISRKSASACRACGGSGSLVRSGTVTDVRTARAAASKRYTALQQSRKFVPVGGAWVPVEIEPTLRSRDTAVLKRAVAPPCGGCLGLGVEDCRKCGAVGSRPCSNGRCKQGWVVERVTAGLEGQEDLQRKVKCRTCAGTGREICVACGGKCNVPCAVCTGTGERPVCGRCDGAGFLPCPRCAGGGDSRGVRCTTCAGEGVQLCSVCRGDGRKKSP